MGAMKLFEVEIVFRAVVLAESDADAFKVTDGELREIVSDQPPEVNVINQIETEDDCPDGWDENCTPYKRNTVTTEESIGWWLDGGVCETAPFQVVRDANTIDMFSEGAAQ